MTDKMLLSDDFTRKFAAFYEIKIHKTNSNNNTTRVTGQGSNLGLDRGTSIFHFHDNQKTPGGIIQIIKQVAWVRAPATAGGLTSSQNYENIKIRKIDT